MNDGNTILKLIIFSLLYADDLHKASGEEHAQIMQKFWDDNDEKKSKNDQKDGMDQ